MKLKKGIIVDVQAYKHDGTLYRQWNGVKVIRCNLNEYILFMYKTRVAENNKQKWTIREPFIWRFPKKGFYNTTVLLRDDGPYYYTNLASPAIFEDNAIKFIDYDLDIKSYPKTMIKILDKNDFSKNKIKFNYSNKLIKIIDETTQKLMIEMKRKENFFDLEKTKIFYKKLIDEKLLPKNFWKNSKFIK